MLTDSRFRLDCTPGHIGVVRMLLESGANVDTRDAKEFTPLVAAAQEGHEAVCDILLGFAATIDAGNYRGTTALMTASKHGHLAVVTLLLKHSVS